MSENGDKAIVGTIERIMEKARQREAAMPIQLPLWPEPKRGTPNSFIRSALFAAIQSKDRVFLKEATLASQRGISVKFTGEQLNQEDLSVWETLAHLARQHPLGCMCEFTAHGLLKSLGQHTGLSQHKQLHSTIIRLTACAVEITHEGKTYFGPLVKSGLKDELTSHYRIELNRELIRLFGDNQWTALDWQQRQQLRGKLLAQALHAFYSSHRQPFPIRLDTLRGYVGSRNIQRAGFKVKLRTALEELVSIGFLTGYDITGDAVTVVRAIAVLPQNSE
ncbi:MAG: plasmid replication initiator TrfA [Candidatus Accumulibacter sp.]|uniref:plasmid replication initiator TrfA n=1 Tax=Accumulibacter sp. TaxID=2053492 RepID=UPI0025F3B029|nr:plasmid replication initiator TrfA [Accumulibacter sp.]MCM8597562.1 plasmid replication initiator TrfA [Accumulibacter sp.]